MLKHIVISIIFLIALISGSVAQDESLSMTVSKNPVPVGERFKLTITLKGGQGNIVPPSFNGFSLYAGPSKSSSTQWINGVISMEVSHSYFLVPEKIGTYTIEPASAQTGGKTLSSNELKIEVIKQSDAAANSPRNSQPASGGGSGDCFVRMYSNKSKVIVGEPLVVNYYLYNRYPRFDLEQHEQLPQHSGFWKDDKLVQSPSWNQDLERIDGKDFRRAHLATQVLIPQRAGELKLEQYKAQVAVGNRRSFFMNRMELKSNTLTIEVSRPPNSGKGAAFNGAVGDLDINVSVDRSDLDVNDALNLSVRISGKGNLVLINELDLELPDEFEVYDPKIKDKISTSGGGMSGSRTFEYLVIPRYPGDYKLPPIEFQFYDYTEDRYRSISSDEISIQVQGDAVLGAEGAPKVIRKEGVSELGTDIRHIRNKVRVQRIEGEYFPGSWQHWTGVFSPFILLGLFLIYKGKREELDADLIGTKQRRAGKVAARQLKQAKAYLDSGDDNMFYTSLYQAMNDYASQKFAIPLSEVEKGTVQTVMMKKGLETNAVNSWIR
ncbi:MAG: protein BatD, partial [Flavobacteriales bacterium]|nr:protein BatD [Flavobacteriales bacterium]